MVSFDNFDEMHKFAREVDEGIKCLEDKILNPEQLRYGDKKANEKANLCLDTLEEEILNIQAEVEELIKREEEELQLLIEERDEYATYAKDIETGIDDFRGILEPHGYKHRQPKDSTPLSSSSSSSLQLDCGLLENMSASLVPRDVSADDRDHQMYTSQNSDDFGNYYTPDLFKKPEQRKRNNGMLAFNCTVQDYSTLFPDRGRTKKEDDMKTVKPNKALLTETFLYTPDSGRSNPLCANTTFTDKKKLRNDILTPKANRTLQVTTPPDPGFSVISQQIYRLNMGRYKQSKENKVVEI